MKGGGSDLMNLSHALPDIRPGYSLRDDSHLPDITRSQAMRSARSIGSATDTPIACPGTSCSGSRSHASSVCSVQIRPDVRNAFE